MTLQKPKGKFGKYIPDFDFKINELLINLQLHVLLRGLRMLQPFHLSTGYFKRDALVESVDVHIYKDLFNPCLKQANSS